MQLRVAIEKMNSGLLVSNRKQSNNEIDSSHSNYQDTISSITTCDSEQSKDKIIEMHQFN